MTQIGLPCSLWVIARCVCVMQEMVCVEAALASSGPVELAAGKTWSAKQVFVSSKL